MTTPNPMTSSTRDRAAGERRGDEEGDCRPRFADCGLGSALMATPSVATAERCGDCLNPKSAIQNPKWNYRPIPIPMPRSSWRAYSIRSEERRVGKEGRSRWSPYHLKKKKKI